MSAFPRNAPCPCGSGVKYKRCCIGRERELLAQAEAVEEVFALPSVSPLLRPCERVFEEWADALVEPELTRELIEEGGRLVSADERARIVRACASECGDLLWLELMERAGGVEVATTTLLVGSITAALREERAVDEGALYHLEECEGCRSGPAEAVIEACDLWSFTEAARTSDAEAGIGVATAEAWTADHELRLELLVERVRRQLPLESHAAVSPALERACDEFERKPDVRGRLATLLLADAVDTFELIDERAA